MTLVRWNPWRGLVSPDCNTDALVDNFLTGSFTRGMGNASSWTPMVDIREDKDAYVIEAELPGMDKDDVKITCHDGVLTIEGEKKYERKEEDEKYYRRVERRYGRFSRSFRLPAEVDAGNVRADYCNGVLSMHVPKTEVAKPRTIEIAVK